MNTAKEWDEMHKHSILKIDEDKPYLTDIVLSTTDLSAMEQRPVLFDFGVALRWLKVGYRVARTGWNGKGMFVFLVAGSVFKVNRPPLLGIYPEGTEISYHAHIDMQTADNKVVPWLASQTDVLAEDWQVVPDAEPTVH